MSNMELQVKELTRYNQNMTNVEIRVKTMSEEVSQMTHKIREYDETINTCVMIRNRTRPHHET